MGDKAKKKREWDSEKKGDALPKLGDLNDVRLRALADWLYQWTEDMNSWGRDVRHDIIRLEGASGLDPGDPGDPPDGPPPDKRK